MLLSMSRPPTVARHWNMSDTPSTSQTWQYFPKQDLNNPKFFSQTLREDVISPFALPLTQFKSRRLLFGLFFLLSTNEKVLSLSPAGTHTHTHSIEINCYA